MITMLSLAALVSLPLFGPTRLLFSRWRRAHRGEVMAVVPVRVRR